MFIPWERIPGGGLPDEAIASIVPDLAVEVLSPSNTQDEMKLKRQEYFTTGVRLVWIVDPETQTAEAYTSPTDLTPIPKAGTRAHVAENAAAAELVLSANDLTALDRAFPRAVPRPLEMP